MPTHRSTDADGRRPRELTGRMVLDLPRRLLRGRRRRQRRHDPRRGVDLRRRRDRRTPIRPGSPSRARSPRPRRRTRCIGRSRARIAAHGGDDRRRGGRRATPTAGRSPACSASALLAHPTDRRADHIVPLAEVGAGPLPGHGPTRSPANGTLVDRAVARRRAACSAPGTASSCAEVSAMSETLDLSIFVRARRRHRAHGPRGRGRRLRRLHPQDREAA